MSPEYRRKLDSVLRSAWELPAPIGSARERLKNSDITFVEAMRGAYRVIAIFGSSVEWWFDARGEWIGTAAPGSCVQTYLHTGELLIDTPEIQKPLRHVCAGCSRSFSSWEEHDFGGCVRAAQEMAR